MLAVAASVAPVILMAPRAFDPAYVVQFTCLFVCVVSVVTIGWTAIRWKNDLARFRGRHFLAMGLAMSVLGLLVLAAGLATGNALTASFALIGLIYGPAVLRFHYLRTAPHPRWWLGWHLNAVCGLFNAVHGTVLGVAYQRLVDPDAGDGAMLVTHPATGAMAIVLRVWLGQRYSAPMGFVAPRTRASA